MSFFSNREFISRQNKDTGNKAEPAPTYSFVPEVIPLPDLPESDPRPTMDTRTHKVSLSFSEGQIVFTPGFKDANLANDETNYDYASQKIASYCLMPEAEELWRGIYLEKAKTDPFVRATKTLAINVIVDTTLDDEGEYTPDGTIFLKNPQIIYEFLHHEGIHCDQGNEIPNFQDVRRYPDMTSALTTIVLLEAEAQLRAVPLRYWEPRDGEPLFSDASLLLQSTPGNRLSARPDHISYFDAYMTPGTYWYERYKENFIKAARTIPQDAFSPTDNGYEEKAQKRLEALGLRPDQIDQLKRLAQDAVQYAEGDIAKGKKEQPPTHVVYTFTQDPLTPWSEPVKPKVVDKNTQPDGPYAYKQPTLTIGTF